MANKECWLGGSIGQFGSEPPEPNYQIIIQLLVLEPNWPQTLPQSEPIIN